MARSITRRTGALLTSTALVAGLMAAAAAPAAAQNCTYEFPDEGGTYTDGTVKSGDVLCGGPGNDVVEHMTGGVFYGGPGDDAVFEKEGGRFWGNVGDDTVYVHSGGTFVGGFGSDTIEYLVGGTFEGGPGRDWAWQALDGLFLGGEGFDVAYLMADGLVPTAARPSGASLPASGRAALREMRAAGEHVTAVAPEIPEDLDGATFIGGTGRDGVAYLYGGDFHGGWGEDLALFVVGGDFFGGRHTDVAYLIDKKGRFLGGRGDDEAWEQQSGTFLGNRGNDSLGSSEEFIGPAAPAPYGQWAGLFNGGPGSDSVIECTNGSGGTTKKVEDKTSSFCDSIDVFAP